MDDGIGSIDPKRLAEEAGVDMVNVDSKPLSESEYQALAHKAALDFAKESGAPYPEYETYTSRLLCKAFTDIIVANTDRISSISLMLAVAQISSGYDFKSEKAREAYRFFERLVGH